MAGDRTLLLQDTTIAFLALSWVTVLLRCYVRSKVTSAFRTDDWLMVLSLFLFTAFSGLLFEGCHLGMGSVGTDVSTPLTAEIWKFQIISDLVYVVTTATIKLSVGFLLLRIIVPTQSPIYRNSIYLSMVLLVTFTTITFFVILFQCHPVSYAWDRITQTGTCIGSNIIVKNAYAISAINLVFDWGYALLPIPMLWKTKMTIQMKVSVILILGMGVIASTATIVRFPYIWTLQHSHDPMHDLTGPVLWTTIELGLGITAASLATLRPLIRKIPGFSSSSSASRPTDTHGYQRSHDLSYMRRTEETTSNDWESETGQRASGANLSQDPIVTHKGIEKRIDVRLEYCSGP